ncbi:hypothetical protein ACFXAO_04075 [Streptomyces lavendulae]|uniref:hypothetical protein n=1 Tax=Streptomyces lavendulae TaxID=1914 RepID=UPI003687A19F
MKNVLGRAATVALAAAVLPMTMSTTASASASANTVHWQNVATSVCVNWEEDWNQSVKLTPVGPCSTSNNLDSSQWREVSVDGKYWTFRPSRYATGGWSDLCLTSYNTLVYLDLPGRQLVAAVGRDLDSERLEAAAPRCRQRKRLLPRHGWLASLHGAVEQRHESGVEVTS